MSLARTYGQSRPPAIKSICPTKRQILILYRSLLRTTTYLPDPVLRTYANGYVRNQFTRCRDKPQERTADYFKYGKDQLNSLERAVQGDERDLEKVMQQAYGRKGKRRRELISDLLRSEKVCSTLKNSTIQTFTQELTDPKKGFTPSPKLVALLVSQQQNHPPDSERSKIRKTSPHLEQNNIWGRPLPTKLKASQRARFWATTLDKMLPPLPVDEWNRLRDLATGVIPFKGPPPRRPRGLVCMEGSRGIEGEWGKWVAATEEEDPLGRKGGNRGKWGTETEKAETGSQFRLAARSWRRLWGGIWCHSPKVIQDANSNNWVITWGSGRGKTLSGAITEPSAQDVELFEGIENVSKPGKPSKRKPRRSRSFV